MSRVAGGHIKIPVAIERQSLRASKPAVKNCYLAALTYAIDAVETGSGRPGHVQIVAGMKCQVIDDDGGFQGGKNKQIAAGADFKNRAAAIAYIKIFVLVEGDSGGYAHAFDPLLAAAIGGNAMNGAVVAGGYEQISGFVDGQARGIN